MALTSDELNYLVYKYLLESGFTHSAFAFGNESYVDQKSIAPSRAIPPGALISFVQKGLQYLELEANLNEVGEMLCGEVCLIVCVRRMARVCVVKRRRCV
jgi:transducin (beta)-like 1